MGVGGLNSGPVIETILGLVTPTNYQWVREHFRDLFRSFRDNSSWNWPPKTLSQTVSNNCDWNNYYHHVRTGRCTRTRAHTRTSGHLSTVGPTCMCDQRWAAQ